MSNAKQTQVLSFIHNRLSRTGVSPSYDEIGTATGLRSKSAVAHYVDLLVRGGFVARLPNRARALEVRRLPADLEPEAPDAWGASAAAAPGRTGSAVPVRLMGRIAAGSPVSALQVPGATMNVPASFLGAGEHFALKVTGESMRDAGILDGDTAIIRRQSHADNGDIVVALIDEEEATLKRFRRTTPGFVALEAENPAFVTRHLPSSRVRIQGRLSNVVRQYSH